jgi:hypothetical protein
MVEKGKGVKKNLIQPYELQIGEFYKVDYGLKQARGIVFFDINGKEVMTNNSFYLLIPESAKFDSPILFLGIQVKKSDWFKGSYTLFENSPTHKKPNITNVQVLSFLYKESCYFTKAKFIKCFERIFY